MFKEHISHSKEYGFIFPSSDIYDGLAATYDQQLAQELKIISKQYWWKAMTQMHQNIAGIDASILAHPKNLKAFKYVDAFNDPLIDNKRFKKRYRADVLIEDYIEKINKKILKEITKAKKAFWRPYR